MRLVPAILTATLLTSSQGCLALEFLGGRCTQEQLVVTWPSTITRNGLTVSTLLVSTVTPENIDATQFARLRDALVSGGTNGLANVTWTVPAFNVNGGYIAFTHAAPLTRGETQQVGVTFEGGGWGAQPVTAAFPPAISVRADNFTATSASGSITVLDSAPLRLQIDVTTRNAAGETMRLTGEAGFAYQKVTKTCT